MKRVLSTAFLAGLFALAVFAPGASAAIPFCLPGSGAGQCKNPQGVAVDHETGRVYIADNANHRINVFKPNGDFISAFGWGVANGESKFQTCTVTCQAGLKGAGLGQFSNPRQIAVDNIVGSANRHAVYVMDGNRRLQKFDVEPEPVTPALAFPVPLGSGECQFARTNDPLAVGPGGVIYVADLIEKGANDLVNRIQKFDPDSGACVDETVLIEGSANRLLDVLAVDAAENVFADITGSGAVTALRKYNPAGELVKELEEVLTSHIETRSLSIDASGNLFAAQRDGVAFGGGVGAFSGVVTEYSPSGDPRKRFGYGTSPTDVTDFSPGIGIFNSAAGDVFVNAGSAGVRYVKVPEDNRPIVVPAPCKADPLGNTKATLNAFVNPEGISTTVHFEYISDTDFDANKEVNPSGSGFGGEEPGEKPATSSPESESIGSDFLANNAQVEVSLIPETKYHCRVVATNAEGSVTGPEGAFTTLEPLEIGATWASEVGTEAATLIATVNPLGIPTTAYFQYVDEATFGESGFSEAIKVPAGEPIDFGAGESFKAGSAKVTGLSPATAYRYRIVATNGLISKEIPGPTRSFRTFRLGVDGGDLPDDRAWELVSPIEKNSAEVAVPGAAGGLFIEGQIRIQAAAVSGDQITYTSWSSFADPDAAPGASQYLSRRGPGGWGTENISLADFEGEPLVQLNPLNSVYRGFSDDLRFGAAVLSQPMPGGKRVNNLYLRYNQAGALLRATPEDPVINSTTDFCIDFAGASEDGSRVFFAANSSYAGAPVGANKTFNLYEWSAAEGLEALSVLPGKTTPVVPTDKTVFGAVAANGTGHCQVGQTVVRNVISDDGRRAFWTYVPGEGKATQLLARIDGEETIQLDKKVSGTGSSGEGVFLAASNDGSKVFFTSKGKLIAGGGEGDLYLYDFDSEAPLKDLTPGGAGVKGMVGASEDGSHAYFVATGVLTEGENNAGQKAEAGESNLYLYREGQIDFLAVLGDADGGVWAPGPDRLRARVSPDGRHLAFLSSEAESLVGYDNAIAEGAHCQLSLIGGPLVGLPLVGSPLCPQAFLYDADSGELACASCNPSGSRPFGPTILPAWSNPQEGPRYLSGDGKRLFFETFDPLLPGDENDKRDVYELELAGSGSCDQESAGFDAAAGGCHYLISGGKSTDETFLLDASASGRDVFFATRGVLVSWDTNGNYDVYDAREGGGFPEPTTPPICSGEACKPSTPAPPSPQSPGTLTFSGPSSASKGGLGPCLKGKVRRRGRCVKPPRKASKPKPGHRRAASNGRAAR